MTGIFGNTYTFFSSVASHVWPNGLEPTLETQTRVLVPVIAFISESLSLRVNMKAGPLELMS